MSVREKLMKMPVWKVVIIIILSLSILIVVVEELFISRVFHFIGHIVSVLEVQSKDDASDWKETKELSNELEIKNACHHIQWAKKEIESAKIKHEKPFMYTEKDIERGSETLNKFNLNESDCVRYVE